MRLLLSTWRASLARERFIFFSASNRFSRCLNAARRARSLDSDAIYWFVYPL
jgi:hypothetical protein